MKHLRKLWRMLVFPLQFKGLCILIKKHTKPIFSYPLLLYLEFIGKEEIRNEYINTSKHFNTIADRVIELWHKRLTRKLSKTITRQEKLENLELSHRYYRFVSHYQQKKTLQNALDLMDREYANKNL